MRGWVRWCRRALVAAGVVALVMGRDMPNDADEARLWIETGPRDSAANTSDTVVHGDSGRPGLRGR